MVFLIITRMHSSRMHTVHSSSHLGGVSTRHPWDQAPPRSGTPQAAPLNFPLGCGPGPDPPQLPPWLWAWTRSPSTFPLGVGLETSPKTCCKACWDTTCNAYWDSTPWRPVARHAGIPPAMHAGIAPPCGQTHTCKHITLPQTSFTGGNNLVPEATKYLHPKILMSTILNMEEAMFHY